MEEIRINKYIAKCGICSRRDADKLINKGEILINDKQANLFDCVTLKDKVFYKGNLITPKNETIIMINKPEKVVCTSRRFVGEQNIYDYFNLDKYIFPIGRLDKNSRGLLLLTNNGDLSKYITSSHKNIEKEYEVEVDKSVTKEFLQKMGAGVVIDNIKTKPCKIRKIGDKRFNIILTQGLNRQIRKMSSALGYNVIDLNRIRIANIKLAKLKIGKSYKLNENEVKQLKEFIGYNG